VIVVAEFRCLEPCEHVLCNPLPAAALERAPAPPSTGWRGRLDDAEIREVRAARLAAQARGYGLLRDHTRGT
jgi:hypothetical protein